MTRCPNTTTPRQHLGRKRYRLARREMRCVLEEGHTGPCAMEPLPSVGTTLALTNATHTRESHNAEIELHGRCSVMTCEWPATPVTTQLEPGPQTPEQIAAGDARYREMLRRKYGHR